MIHRTEKYNMKLEKKKKKKAKAKGAISLIIHGGAAGEPPSKMRADAYVWYR
jgi:hypothetical protein